MSAPLNLDAMYLYWNNRDERPYARIARVGTDPLPEVEITEEVYDYALNVLPPEYLPGGAFYVIERVTGEVVSTYYRRGDQFFHRYLDLKAPKDELARHFTWDHDPGFLTFMRRADKLVSGLTGGMGVLDFADACWADLYEELGTEATDEDILDTLADADGIFAAMREIA